MNLVKQNQKYVKKMIQWKSDKISQNAGKNNQEFKKWTSMLSVLQKYQPL